MGLFDQVAGMLGGQNGKAGMYQAILSWIMEQGGIQALLGKFQQGGLGTIVESWISIGGNQSVSAVQITKALGLPAVTALASKLGIEPQAASNVLAEYLPKMVDTLSPNGAVDGQQDLMTTGLNLLKGKFFN